MSVVELLELGACRRKILEIESSAVERCYGRRRGYTHYTVRPPKATFRIDKPPLSVVFLEAETTRGLQLWAGCPAAILVAVGRAGVLGEVGLLLFSSLLQIFVGVNFALPILIFVLSVLINKRIEIVVCHAHNLRILYALARDDFEIRNTPSIFVRLAEREQVAMESDDFRFGKVARV